MKNNYYEKFDESQKRDIYTYGIFDVTHKLTTQKQYLVKHTFEIK